MDMKQVLVETVHYERIDHPVYKYRLLMDLSVICDFFLPFDVEGEYFSLHLGLLTAKEGYCWDGPSVPWYLIWLTYLFGMSEFLRASLFHDIIYQMLRQGQILHERYDKKQHKWVRKMADEMMRLITLVDGMGRIRARWCWAGVRVGGASSTQPTYYSN